MELRNVASSDRSHNDWQVVMNDSLQAQLQNRQYRFPYHHIPHFRSAGRPSVVRTLSWGLEYLCYMSEVRAIATGARPESVLDVGCGDGVFLSMLSDAGIKNLFGIDVIDDAIRHAQAFVPEAVIDRVDVRAVTETFDLVTSIEVLEHIPDDEVPEFLGALRNRVKVGGHLLICVPTKVRELNRKHFRHYDAALLEHSVAKNAPDLVLRKCKHVFAESILISVLGKLLINRFWTVEIPALQSLVWQYVQRALADAAPGKGCHLIGLFERRDLR